MKDKIIYQVLIDRFSGNIIDPTNENVFMGGNLKGIINHLDYIKSMGFNTLLLSPFLTSTNYHGYHTEDFYTVDNHFGTMEDVLSLVKESHVRGIKLMFDFVPNHCSCQHPFFVDAMKNVNSAYRKWFYIYGKNSYRTFLQYKELPKFDLNHPDASAYMIDICKYWVSLGFDYVRIDHAIGPPFSFLHNLVEEVKKTSPEVEFIGEVWAQGVPRSMYHTLSLKHTSRNYLFGIDQERIQMDYIDVFDGLFDFKFTELLIDAMVRDKKCVGNSRLQEAVDKHFANYPESFDLVLMLDNHDMNRFLYYCGDDVDKLLDALTFVKNQKRSFSIYYGTECLMTNHKNIFDKTAYADLRVRNPFQLSTPKIADELSAIILKQ